MTTRHKPLWNNHEAYAQLCKLAGLRSGKEEKEGKARPADKPNKVAAHVVSAIILDELSRTFSNVCNFAPEVELLNDGRLLEAYQAVLAKCEGMTVVDPLTAWVKAQAKASVSKLSVPGLDVWTLTAKQWWADEHQCHRTNQKLDAYRNRLLKGDRPLPWGREVERARDFCAYVLGDCPDLESVLAATRFGPGSSVGVSGDSTHYATKIHSWDCSDGAVDLAVAALALDKGAWEVSGFDPREATNPNAIEGFKREARTLVLDQVVNHDNLMFIFKNAKSLRSIGAQPTLSGMVQLGVDASLKALLRDRANVDLTDQGLNQRLAWLGSRDWNQPDPWCTLDKSSASNLVAKRLPGFLFPREWAKLLWKIRTPLYAAPSELGGGTHVYEMYAGMGNGTTFGVESLIFSAFAYATSELATPADCLRTRSFSVYGDDVILKRSHADRYVGFAEYLGFRMNRDKSFTEGPFRESCGADYWEGQNVRPAYVNGESDLDELTLIGVHNTLMDSSFVALTSACRRIRALWVKHFSWPLPSDPIGGLGFRTTSKVAWEYVLKDGKPALSPVWFRPRGYVLEIRPKLDVQKGLGSYTQIMVALQKGTQGGVDQLLSLPFRRAIKVRVVPEQDLIREDLVCMLRNQLTRLALRKEAPWWNTSRGR